MKGHLPIPSPELLPDGHNEHSSIYFKFSLVLRHTPFWSTLMNTFFFTFCQQSVSPWLERWLPTGCIHRDKKTQGHWWRLRSSNMLWLAASERANIHYVYTFLCKFLRTWSSRDNVYGSGCSLTPIHLIQACCTVCCPSTNISFIQWKYIE